MRCACFRASSSAANSFWLRRTTSARAAHFLTICTPYSPNFLRRCRSAAERVQEQARGQGGTQWCWSAPPVRGGHCGSRAVEVQPVWCADSPAAGIGKCAHGSARAVHMHAQPCRLVGLRCRTGHVGVWWRPNACVWVAGPGTGGVQRHMLREAQTPVVARSSWRKNGVKCGLLSVKQLVRTQTVLLSAVTTKKHYPSPACVLRAALAFMSSSSPHVIFNGQNISNSHPYIPADT